jgi:hypothetical protein
MSAGSVSRSLSFLNIKINSVKFQDKGFTPEEARGLCEALENARFDYVELSGGTYESLAFKHKREGAKKREEGGVLLGIRRADRQASF